MIALKQIVIAILVYSLFACSSFKVHQDYNVSTNFTRLNAYAWLPSTDKNNDDHFASTPLIKKRILDAVNQSLSMKGFRKASLKQASFLVQYHFQVTQAEQMGGVRTGIGLGTSNRGNYGGISLSFGKGKGEQSRLTIDILNPLNKKLLWRGSTVGEFSGNDTPEESTENIYKGVAAIIKRFPPK